MLGCREGRSRRPRICEHIIISCVRGTVYVAARRSLTWQRDSRISISSTRATANITTIQRGVSRVSPGCGVSDAPNIVKASDHARPNYCSPCHAAAGSGRSSVHDFHLCVASHVLHLSSPRRPCLTLLRRRPAFAAIPHDGGREALWWRRNSIGSDDVDGGGGGGAAVLSTMFACSGVDQQAPQTSLRCHAL